MGWEWAGGREATSSEFPLPALFTLLLSLTLLLERFIVAFPREHSEK